MFAEASRLGASSSFVAKKAPQTHHHNHPFHSLSSPTDCIHRCGSDTSRHLASRALHNVQDGTPVERPGGRRPLRQQQDCIGMYSPPPARRSSNGTQNGPQWAQWHLCTVFGCVRGVVGASCELCTFSSSLRGYLRDDRANLTSLHTSNEQHPPSPPPSPAAMPPMPKQHRLRSPPSSSRESVVCKKRLVSPRLAECSQSGTRWSHNTNITHWEANESESDGIARVHGMNNVQAEELVEYEACINMGYDLRTNALEGSHLASRACA